MTDEPHGLEQIAASNRERIRSLEHEMERMRDWKHGLDGELAAVRYLGERIRELGEDVKELTEQVQKLARRALERPTQGALSVLGQYLALIVAVAALIIAARR